MANENITVKYWQRRRKFHPRLVRLYKQMEVDGYGGQKVNFFAAHLLA